MHGERGTFRLFRDGVLLLAEGMSFVRRERSLWRLAAMPIGFATIFMGVAVSLFVVRLDAIHAFVVSPLPVLEATDWWTWIWVGPGRLGIWLLGWLGVLVAFTFSVIAALLGANLASAPFLDLLSQRVEAISRGVAPPQSAGFSNLIVDTLRSFNAELRRLGFLAGIWVVLAGVGFALPGAHLVTGPVLILATMLLLPLDYSGFALDRRQIPFRARRRWLWENLPTMSGFGCVAFVACLVPGLNLLMMPALVTAGTLLVLRASPRDSDSNRSSVT